MFKWIKKHSERILPVLLGNLWGTDEISEPTNQTAFLSYYSSDPWIYSAVWILATTASSMPMVLIKDKGLESEEVIKKHKALDFLRRPNPDEEAFDFWEATFSYLELAGESFWEKDFSKMNKLREMYWLRPDRMTLKADAARKHIEEYIYKLDDNKDTQEVFTPEEIVHIKYFHPTDDWRGHSTLESLKSTLVNSDYGWRWARRFMKQYGTSGGYLTTQQRLGEMEVGRLGSKWSGQFEASKDKTPLLPAGLTFEELGKAAKEGGLLDLLKLLREARISAQGVPPVLLGLLEYARYSNYDLQLRAFHLLTLKPKLMKVESAINRGVLPYFTKKKDNLTFEFDKRLAGFVDIQVFVKVLGELFDRGSLTPNDLIRLTGMGDTYEDGGDEHYLGERQQEVGAEPSPESDRVDGERQRADTEDAIRDEIEGSLPPPKSEGEK